MPRRRGWHCWNSVKTVARRSPDKKQGRCSSAAGRAAGALGVSAATSQRAAAGSDEMRAGTEQFLEEVHRRARLGPEQAKGFFFERIEAAKFNTDAANKGISERARVRGDNHPVVDIEVVQKDGTVAREVQLKTGRYAKRNLGNKRYSDVKKVTPKGHADQKRGIEDEVTHRTVRSGGTTKAELDFATENPKLYASLLEARQVVRETAVAGAEGAIAGAIMGCVTSLVRNGWAWHKGEEDGNEAAKEIGKDTARSFAHGGSAAAGSALVRHVGHKVGIEALKKANIAAAVASGLKDVSVAVMSWVKGDISAEEAFIRLGDTGCGTLSGIYGGAAAGAIFGPVGAAAGSVVGYLLSACVYQSCVATFQKAHLAEEESERVVALCAEAVRRMDEQRRHIEREVSVWLEVRQNIFDRHLRRIDDALRSGSDSEQLAKSLSLFALSFGKELRHEKFEDFQRFVGRERRLPRGERT